MKHGGGGVIVWGCFAGDTVSDLFRIQGTTSMATTAFCSDTPSHLVCAQWDYHLFFNRTMTLNTPPGCVRAIWPGMRVMEWPGLHNHPTSTQLRLFGMSWITEWRKSSQQVLSICGNSFKIVGKAFQVKLVEIMPRVCKAISKLSSFKVLMLSHSDLSFFVMFWGCFACETVCDLFRIQGTTSMATTAFCSDTPSHLVCA